jgi:hypothetical protein
MSFCLIYLHSNKKNHGTIKDEVNIGKECKKKDRPFKSTFKKNTIKGVINHPHLNIPAYVFHEDDSYVECRRIEILN